MGDGARQRDPLPLPAGELVREPVGHRRLEADVLEHLAHASPAIALDAERPERLAR